VTDQSKTVSTEVPPESQFSMNWTMIDGYGANVQITMRATHLAEYPDALKTRKDFMEKAQLAGWTFPAAPVRPTPGIAPSVPAAAPAATSAPAPLAPAAPGTNTVLATRMDVKPRTDGKLDIEFYETGHNWPDVKKAAVDVPGAIRLLAACGAWTAEQFAGAKSYPVQIAVDWREGKPNGKGGNYKDIVAVRPG
jgi:hypothetical protein